MGHTLKKAVNTLLSPMGFCVAQTMEKTLRRKRKISLLPDFVRLSSLELCAEEIELAGLKGNVAELGVYRGDFASHINRLFPKRKLYLFDTFEGFDNKDVAIDKERNFSSDDQDFSNTSIQIVLEKMALPENCIIKQGYFPESIGGLEDTFVFVSIDADLFQPIYEGLKYFYPRLASGGYIFVHDFNNKRYLGARKAVVDFCSENNCPYFPLSDSCGTAVITK